MTIRKIYGNWRRERKKGKVYEYNELGRYEEGESFEGEGEVKVESEGERGW